MVGIGVLLQVAVARSATVRDVKELVASKQVAYDRSDLGVLGTFTLASAPVAEQ
jgi:hypothetical protein